MAAVDSRAVKWVTRERPKTDRIACPWLIRRFIDPEAEFVYVPADEVLAVAEREGALSYDAPGARFTHRDGLCSFEVLVEEYAIDDPAVALLARIVHGADVADEPPVLGLGVQPRQEREAAERVDEDVGDGLGVLGPGRPDLHAA